MSGATKPAAAATGAAAASAAGSPLLAFEDVGGGYGDTVVLRGVGGAVASGQVLGILGRNGVGKTTLLRLLMGYLAPVAGVIRWRGQALGRLPTHARRRLGMSYAPQEGLVFDPLTVRENLTLHRADRTLTPYRALLDAFPRLAERLDQRAGTLSGGEKKLLSFCRAIADAAPLTLLDEPSEGVQQENLDHMSRFIRERQAQGAAFVIVEQNLAFLLPTMDQALVLDHGECVLAGVAADLPRSALEAHLAV